MTPDYITFTIGSVIFGIFLSGYLRMVYVQHKIQERKVPKEKIKESDNEYIN